MLNTGKATSPLKLIALLIKFKRIPVSKSQMAQLGFLLLFILCCLTGCCLLLLNKIKKIEGKQKRTSAFIQQLKSGSISFANSFGMTPIPLKLATVPYGEDSGLVVGVKEVHIRGVDAPYNATLLTSPVGYDLFFRYDTLSYNAKHAPFLSHVGVVHLNTKFEQEDQEFKQIDLGSVFPEDPRAVAVEDQLYLVYNTLRNDRSGRSMQVAQLDRDTFHINYTTTLELNLQWIEKNWSPFEYRRQGEKASLFFEYQLVPHKVLQLPDPKVNVLQRVFSEASDAFIQIPWEVKWGRMRGGTPAQLIDNEFLAFFHSSFEDQSGILWYVIGAYTFESQPPFKLTSISKHPILYRGIYTTPHSVTAPINKRVCFPCGFVVEKDQDETWLHVALGENDSGIKILTLNKQKLFKSLCRFSQ